VIPSPRMHQSDVAPPKLPWNCPPHIQRLYREMLRLRYRLTPYYYSYAVHAAASGEPIIRPLVYAFPDDPEVRSMEDQCLIGDALLAAPVMAKGATRRAVYLPKGRWICWWSGQCHAGPRWIEAEAPPHEARGLPLFVREGSLLPLQPLANQLADEAPSSLHLELFPSHSGTWTLRVEAGREIHFAWEFGETAQVTIDNRSGSEREFSLRLHAPG